MNIRNLIKKVLLEDVNNRKLKLFALDWDDNILRMPTKIYLKTDNGGVVGMSTDDFATYRSMIGKEPFDYEGETIVSLDDNAFRDFTHSETFLRDTMEAIKKNRLSPSFMGFKKALIKASPFSIITARGHSPNVIKKGVKLFIDLVLSPEEKNKMIDNIKKIFEFEGLEGYYKLDTINKNQLVDVYLDEKGEYYPVSSPEFGKRFNLDSKGGASSPEHSKKLALSDFIEKVYDKVGHLIKSGKYGSVSLGFSDDDVRNVKSMIQHIEDELSVMYPEIKFIVKDTSEGGMRKLVINRVKENENINENYLVKRIKNKLYNKTSF